MTGPEPPICDYEGSDYQASFWDQGGRAYEDQVEAIALKRLLPKAGGLLLEVGAGAGRNTPRYSGFERVVLVDYSLSQLKLARSRLGDSDRYTFVAANAYRLPFADGLFDAATMIRTLHHMADPRMALGQIRAALVREATFILEYANKRNTKSILRYWLGMQKWSPFTEQPVEIATLNFDFHPHAVRSWLKDLGFQIERTLTVSHFRAEAIKRIVPLRLLVVLDSLLQWTGGLWQLTPSVFVRARGANVTASTAASHREPAGWFKCPECGHLPLARVNQELGCSNCGRRWAIRDGIFDFRQPSGAEGAIQPQAKPVPS